ncbi:hypothetical protein AB5J56_09765 [Streptomyces sp. R21]|uniref:SDR family NAD(P)-dependent oxidoreductase n=1 Tax=Streptomyces sp. R21 TaxID=3238627 RepID=A0AB39P3E2_9ACTN
MVTGACGGVGRATARAFAARGDRVAVLARGATARRATTSAPAEASTPRPCPAVRRTGCLATGPAWAGPPSSARAWAPWSHGG